MKSRNLLHSILCLLSMILIGATCSAAEVKSDSFDKVPLLAIPLNTKLIFRDDIYISAGRESISNGDLAVPGNHTIVNHMKGQPRVFRKGVSVTIKEVRRIWLEVALRPNGCLLDGETFSPTATNPQVLNSAMSTIVEAIHFSARYLCFQGGVHSGDVGLWAEVPSILGEVDDLKEKINIEVFEGFYKNARRRRLCRAKGSVAGIGKQPMRIFTGS